MNLNFAKNLLSARASRRGVVLDKNWGAVITGCVSGNVVVANDRHHPFSLHIPRVDDPVPENIESLLTWRSRIPKQLYGREAEFAELYRWCNEPAAIRIRILCGEGGAGKTRLAFELAESLRSRGWQAGQLADPSQPVVFPLSEDGVLLVVDYPEQFSAALERLLRLIKNSELPGIRLRLLLLSRNGQAMQQIVDRYAEPLRSPAMELRPIESEAVSWALFQDGWQEMAKLRGVSAALPLDNADFRAWLNQDAAHAQPLMLLSFALNLIYDPTAIQLGRREILQRLIQRERDRLREETTQYGLQTEGVELLKALAAIPGQLTAISIDALAATLSHPGIKLPAAVEVQRTMLWRQEALCEMQPDLLASVLIHAVLSDRFASPLDAGEWIWFALTANDPSQETFKGRLRRIARLSADRPRVASCEPAPNTLVTALTRLVSREPKKAMMILGSLDPNSLEFTLLPLAVSAARKVVETYEPLVQEDFARHSRAFVIGLTALSHYLADSGDHAGGLAPIRRSLEICERLALEDFAGNAHALAGTLDNLSARLSSCGDRVGSLAATQRSLEICEQMAQKNFATAAPYLARSLNNLSIDLACSGDRAGGLAAIQRAVAIREQMAEENLGANASELSGSLRNLSIRLAESGEHANALAVSRRALEICQRLAQENFTAHAFDLARNLGNISTHLARTGDHNNALASSRRAVEILEWLAQENHAAYAPSLAGNLHNLSRVLAELGDHSSGLTMMRRSLELYEGLAREDFPTHAPDLARCIGNLSMELAKTGDDLASITATRRSLELYEQLAQENFFLYAPYVGRTLNNLSVCLAKSGELEPAIAALERAIDLISPFAEPDGYEQELYISVQQNLLKLRARVRTPSDGRVTQT